MPVAKLEQYHPRQPFTSRIGRIPSVILGIFCVATLISIYTPFYLSSSKFSRLTAQHLPVHAEEILSRCAAVKAAPGPVRGFHDREISDRFEPGTNATLIRNCTIFTGEKNGTVVIHGDILLDKGIVKGLGKISQRIIDKSENLTVIEANGAWVTPGLVDLHSHLGLLSAPLLRGAMDVNSEKGPILPWLRSVDALNTHDDAYELALAGGVTSAQVLPGSGNAIGGQAFVIKLRKTSERSASSMIVEPPHNLNGSSETYSSRWRHMKQACGENLIDYGTRMDTAWSFRSAYNEARKLKESQDDYCLKAEAGEWDSISDTPFPEDFKWEMLVDVLRGKVKISNHCYEAVDLDAIVRLTNEFNFPIASFHHASEAYLVPDLLKKTWGGVPAIAIFATNHRYKREAFRGSEFASRILADEGIPVVMKSDHPVINSRYLIHEAQQAHYFSLPSHFALASVTSTPAIAAGLSHRIGMLQEGSDADVVLWDSHPLQLGATPLKVWVDGIVQIPVPPKDGQERHVVVGRGKESGDWKKSPEAPNWDKERNETLKWDGLPPLQGNKKDSVLFTNVKSVLMKASDGSLKESFIANYGEPQANVLVEHGKVICIGSSCASSNHDINFVDLRGGSISPALMTYGSSLGLEEIAGEPSTGDGEPYDAFKQNTPKILGDVGAVVRAVDGLKFGTRNALTAYRSGVTLATSSLAKPVFLSSGARLITGLSTTFRTGAAHAMERGAIIQDIVALHVVIGSPQPTDPMGAISVSTQLAGLRRLLYGWESNDQETGIWFKKSAEGTVPLVIDVHSADIMASLLILKAEIENNIGSRMRMTFHGASEAHLLAKEIADAKVGVILNPVRPFPLVWDQRRILPGPPLTNDTALVTLLEKGVIVGIGARDAWDARNTRFTLKWAALESNGRVSDRQAYSLVTTDLEALLGVKGVDEESADLVAIEGGSMFDQTGKVVAVISPLREVVDLF